MLIPFGVAVVCSTLSAYVSIAYFGKVIRFQLMAALLLSLSLGCYQAYIGFAAGIILMTIMLRLIHGNSVNRLGKQLGTSVFMGLVGCILYYGIWKVLLRVYDVQAESYSGADEIGILNTLMNLPKTIPAAYYGFFTFFSDDMAGRNILLIPVMVLFAVLPIYLLKKRGKLLFVGIAFIAVMPIALNIICLITPQRGIGHLMSHQMNLVFPFVLALVESNRFHKISFRFLRNCLTALVLFLCVNNVMCAYATNESIALSYKAVETVSTEILDSLNEKTDYKIGDNLLIIGFPDESNLNENNPLQPYNYNSDFDSNVFWHNLSGVAMWKIFMLSTFGIDIGDVTYATYNEIIESEVFKNMNIFPDGNCIEYIDWCYAVKLCEATF